MESHLQQILWHRSNSNQKFGTSSINGCSNIPVSAVPLPPLENIVQEQKDQQSSSSPLPTMEIVEGPVTPAPLAPWHRPQLTDSALPRPLPRTSRCTPTIKLPMRTRNQYLYRCQAHHLSMAPMYIIFHTPLQLKHHFTMTIHALDFRLPSGIIEPNSYPYRFI